MTDNNLLGFIGLMKRSGKAAIGAENALLAMRVGKAKLLLLASDVSKNSIKPLVSDEDLKQAPTVTLSFDKQQLGQALGQKECGVLAVLDTGFAASVCEKLGHQQLHEQLKQRLLHEQKRKNKKIAGKAKNAANRGK